MRVCVCVRGDAEPDVWSSAHFPSLMLLLSLQTHTHVHSVALLHSHYLITFWTQRPITQTLPLSFWTIIAESE